MTIQPPQLHADPITGRAHGQTRIVTTRTPKPAGHLETIIWRPITDRGFDDDETLLVQHADGEVNGAYLDGDQWRNLDATPCPAPVRWAKWPRGRA